MKSLSRILLFFSVAFLSFGSSSVRAAYVYGDAFVSPVEPGASQYDDWILLADGTTPRLSVFGTGPGYGSFPGSSNWPAPIGSTTPTGDAFVTKIANGANGGAYPGSQALYFGSGTSAANVNGGKVGVTDSTPVNNLAKVVFQIAIGEALLYDFFDEDLPVLSYNGGTQNLAANSWDLLEQFDNGTIETPEGDQIVYINSYRLDWDLSNIAVPITSFTITFQGVEHSQVYAMQLDQFAVAVPEPGGFLLATASIFGFGWIRRRVR